MKTILLILVLIPWLAHASQNPKRVILNQWDFSDIGRIAAAINSTGNVYVFNVDWRKTGSYISKKNGMKIYIYKGIGNLWKCLNDNSYESYIKIRSNILRHSETVGGAGPPRPYTYLLFNNNGDILLALKRITGYSSTLQLNALSNDRNLNIQWRIINQDFDWNDWPSHVGSNNYFYCNIDEFGEVEPDEFQFVGANSWWPNYWYIYMPCGSLLYRGNISRDIYNDEKLPEAFKIEKRHDLNIVTKFQDLDMSYSSSEFEKELLVIGQTNSTPLAIHNQYFQTLSSVTGRLSTTSPFVSVISSNLYWSTITNNSVLFSDNLCSIAVLTNVSCGEIIEFTLELFVDDYVFSNEVAWTAACTRAALELPEMDNYGIDTGETLTLEFSPIGLLSNDNLFFTYTASFESNNNIYVYTPTNAIDSGMSIETINNTGIFTWACSISPPPALDITVMAIDLNCSLRSALSEFKVWRHLRLGKNQDIDSDVSTISYDGDPSQIQFYGRSITISNTTGNESLKIITKPEFRVTDIDSVGDVSKLKDGDGKIKLENLNVYGKGLKRMQIQASPNNVFIEGSVKLVYLRGGSLHDFYADSIEKFILKSIHEDKVEKYNRYTPQQLGEHMFSGGNLYGTIAVPNGIGSLIIKGGTIIDGSIIVSNAGIQKVSIGSRRYRVNGNTPSPRLIGGFVRGTIYSKQGIGSLKAKGFWGKIITEGDIGKIRLGALAGSVKADGNINKIVVGGGSIDANVTAGGSINLIKAGKRKAIKGKIGGYIRGEISPKPRKIIGKLVE